MIFGSFYKDPSNTNKKYLRTRIRNLKKYFEKSGKIMIKFLNLLKI